MVANGAVQFATIEDCRRNEVLVVFCGFLMLMEIFLNRRIRGGFYIPQIVLLRETRVLVFQLYLFTYSGIFIDIFVSVHPPRAWGLFHGIPEPAHRW